MSVQIFIYFGTLLSLLCLPERVWGFLWQKCHLYLERKETYLKGKRPAGERLLNFLPGLEAKMSMGLKTTDIEIPEYKFYAKLLHELLDVHRRLGISLRLILPELRSNLVIDLQFEKKIKGLILGGNLQFFVIAMTTWIFIFFSSSLADLPLNPWDLILILIIQVIAVFVFNFLIKRFQRNIFSKFNNVIEGLYLFSSMVEVGLPNARVLSESRILEGDLVRYGEFEFCAERMKEHIGRWRENGVSPKVGVSEVIKEVWHLQEMGFSKFIKAVDLIKFSVLAFFFLPAYFYYLYSIFQFFLVQ